ncbi:hypothetical protein BC567DRAFT_36814 [Phyllosticta citribraziliensis]
MDEWTKRYLGGYLLACCLPVMPHASIQPSPPPPAAQQGDDRLTDKCIGAAALTRSSASRPLARSHAYIHTCLPTDRQTCKTHGLTQQAGIVTSDKARGRRHAKADDRKRAAVAKKGIRKEESGTESSPMRKGEDGRGMSMCFVAAALCVDY